MDHTLFERYSPAIRRLGTAGANSSELVIETKGRDILRYIPFEHVNANAKLVIVGITPGPKQLRLAYGEVQRLMAAGISTATLLHEVKKLGAFGGSAMRPNLLRYLRHFQFDKILRITDVESLWDENAGLFHGTSVIPHAAFTTTSRGESMFAGSFDYVMASPLFRKCFLDCFVSTLGEINPEALYIGLGDCPGDALQWCVENGYLQARQYLGTFCHPSTSGGSAPSVYIRDKILSDLKPTDPVRPRVAKLDQAYARMAVATALLLDGATPPSEPPRAGAREESIQATPALLPPARPARKTRDVPGDEFSEKVIEQLAQSGYLLVRESKYLAEFCAAGQTVYLLKAQTTINHIPLMVHPKLVRDDLVNLLRDSSVSTEYRHHSSMSKFPSKLHTGKRPITYGWLVSAVGLAEAGAVVEGLLELEPAAR
ncbi:hypothetical protein [Pseudomonas fluorescens]|uniref:Uncharacterized protein n=1 Tax=Pseudomonas fluorescens TaxID=294 RepID=A0A5E7AAJ2_PSEFL|nr:hypothetical protein [Pseudomonas fluorescens]VVN73277.1 hypothetical protein PS710_00575 [Pseudomonas fluorescens]